MKKTELIKRLFTNEEIIAIDNRNRELKEENELLKQCLDKLMFDTDVVNVKIH